MKYERKSLTFLLDTAYLSDHGISLDELQDEKLILFCRDSFHELFTFLKDSVLRDGKLGWVLGPLGIGKSITALAFASTMDRTKWNIAWIYLSDYHPTCVLLTGNIKKSIEITYEQLDSLLLQITEPGKRTIVFLDGLNKNVLHDTIKMVCCSWVRGNSGRRCVIVSSMTSRGKTKSNDDELQKIKEFKMFSWTLSEYMEAVSHPEVFENVKKHLDSGEKEKDVTSLIKSKYHFAGGSARFMFNYSTQRVIKELKEAFERVTDLLPMIEGRAGNSSDVVVNTLISKFSDDGNYILVSEYAYVVAALRFGPKLIENLYKSVKHQGNPAFEGWLLEIWFFASLQFNGIHFQHKNGKKGSWKQDNVVIINSKQLGTFPKYPFWMKPAKFNEGGYDAVYIDKERKAVRFVQVTGGMKHSFKIEYFASFMNRLRNSSESFEVETLEIFLVVDKKKLPKFRINGEVTMVQIVGVSGIVTN